MIDLVWLSIGIVLLLGAFAWRFTSKHRARQRLETALVDPDPMVRRSTLENLGEGWIGPHAETLLNLAERETDAGVMSALVTLVARHQWEPVEQGALSELRSWVSRHLATGAPGPNAAAASTGRAQLDSVALLASLTTALGEPVRELRIHQAEGSVAVHPLPSIAPRANDDPGVPEL